MALYKLFNLTHYLLNLHHSAVFELDTIEMGESLEESLVLFTDVRNRRYLSKNLALLYNNKNLLSKFNGKDACRIGYAYGRIYTIEMLKDGN